MGILSKVRLLAVPFDNTYKNQIDMYNAGTQQSFFSSLVKYSQDDCTYCRGEQGDYIAYPALLEDIHTCNYLMYYNKNKWYYCFITHMAYENEETTHIFFERDVYQTWCTNITLLPSFVVRAHSSTDNIGENLVAENLEIGEYEYHDASNIEEIIDLWILIGMTTGIDGTTPAKGGIFHGVYSGMCYFAFAKNDTEGISTLLASLAASGKVNSISTMCMIPKFLLGSVTSGSAVPKDTVTEFGCSRPSVAFTKQYAKPNNTTDPFGTYFPKNNKLYNYPYTGIRVSNNTGSACDFPYEYFSDDNATFTIDGNCAPNPTVFLTPHNYLGATDLREYSMQINGFPMCNYVTDEFKNWLSQNMLNMGLGAATGALSVAIGAGTGNPIALASGAISVMDELAQVTAHTFQPAQAHGNISSGAANCSTGRQTFSVYLFNIQQEFAERIDNYFSMYGYKENRLEVPWTVGRAAWNYIQTIDVNIKGDIPNDDMKKLKAMFNTGVTFWHNINVGDYSQTNTPLAAG